MVNNDDVLAWMNSNAIDSLVDIFSQAGYTKICQPKSWRPNAPKLYELSRRRFQKRCLTGADGDAYSKLSESSH